MTRRMSCSMTVGAVLTQTKTVTRRHVDTWRTLQAGDRLTLIEKGMGLPKGARQVVLAEVVVVSVRVEILAGITAAECKAEGFTDMHPAKFAAWWAESHGYGKFARITDLYQTPCRRIEWRYINEGDEHGR